MSYRAFVRQFNNLEWKEWSRVNRAKSLWPGQPYFGATGGNRTVRKRAIDEGA